MYACKTNLVAVPDQSLNLGLNRIPCAGVSQISAVNLDGWHGLESEVVSTLPARCYGPRFHGLHGQCSNIGREQSKESRCLCLNGELCGADNRLQRFPYLTMSW